MGRRTADMQFFLLGDLPQACPPGGGSAASSPIGNKIIEFDVSGPITVHVTICFKTILWGKFSPLFPHSVIHHKLNKILL